MFQREKTLNYLKTTTEQKLGDNRTKTGRDYINGSLRSISGVAVLVTKSINSSTKVKALKNFFLTNC